MSEYQKKYYRKNRERILERQKAYNAEHKEQKADYDRKRYKKIWKQKAEYNWAYWERRKHEQKAGKKGI